MKVAVVGIGYVGFALAILIAQKHEVIAIDIDIEKVRKINNRISPVKDVLAEDYLLNENLSLKSTTDYKYGLQGANFVIICVPTNYSDALNGFDVSIIKKIVEIVLKYNEAAHIVIKSTVPVDFIDELILTFDKEDIFYSPEFLREGSALYDNLYPSRIVVGCNLNDDGNRKIALQFANLLAECALKNDISVHIVSNNEAASIKLFSNTYLAMRVAYFNELDSFSRIKCMSAKRIIQAVCDDPRIGNYYNNPSFGYGGYCLPKDARQLQSLFREIPNSLISSITNSNRLRKTFLVDQILDIISSKSCNTVGVFRLTMKENSDNYRNSSIIDIIEMLKIANINIIIYEPIIKDKLFKGIKVEKDIDVFKYYSDIILANRISDELKDVQDKIFTADIR